VVKTRRDLPAQAGRSAQAGYREARARQRRSRARAAGLVIICAPLAVAGAIEGAAWLVALGIAGCLWALLTWPRDDDARWSRGAAGERATAALLAELPRRGWVVLHDRALPGSRANLDHLVIGPSGVWVVDTKTYRAALSVRRGRVWAGDHAVPTEVAAWEAQQVADLLDVEVTAIVAVHGAGLRRRGKRCDEVLVVPADRLRRRLRRPGRRRLLTHAQVVDLGRRAAEVLPEYC
jgi:Nuclease-related domain